MPSIRSYRELFPSAPVCRLTPEWRDCHNHQRTRCFPVHDRKRKVFGKDSAGSMPIWTPDSRHGHRQSHGGLDLRGKPFAQPGTLFFVKHCLVSKLSQCLRVKDSLFHRASSRRTRANASSAGISSTVPASISSMRRRSSSSHAAATSASCGSRLASSSSARRARSSGRSTLAMAASSARRHT